MTVHMYMFMYMYTYMYYMYVCHTHISLSGENLTSYNTLLYIARIPNSTYTILYPINIYLFLSLRGTSSHLRNKSQGRGAMLHQGKHEIQITVGIQAGHGNTLLWNSFLSNDSTNEPYKWHHTADSEGQSRAVKFKNSHARRKGGGSIYIHTHTCMIWL